MSHFWGFFKTWHFLSHENLVYRFLQFLPFALYTWTMPRIISGLPSSKFLRLPWRKPLAEWPTDYLVALPRGISRHVVRFIKVGNDIYAAKELLEDLALHEYRVLMELTKLGEPAVQPVAVVTERFDLEGNALDPVLITKHLDFSLPYRSLFAPGVRADTVNRLLDAMVLLLARLHLAGLLWKDVSLSNILFRRDAGAFAAYLVDAETAELHPALTAGQRAHDLDVATVNIFGECCDLQAAGLLDADLDPLELVESIGEKYANLWQELTGVEEFDYEKMDNIESRLRRLNDLGFDISEIDIDDDGHKIRIQPKVVDSGYNARRLLRLTGLDTEEHQARRLLADLDTFRAKYHLHDIDEAIVAHEWLTTHFAPVIQQVPKELAGKRAPAQIYHELLDYRWYQSQREQRSVPILEAVEGYIRDVLSVLPDEQIASHCDYELDMHGNKRQLVNPYDPSQGFIDEDDDLDPPYDPWEDIDEG